MQVDENLKNIQNIDSIMKYKCSSCITKDLLKSNVLGSDSEENENTDPKSDPLSDSMVDKK
jgi:hypothetical protein